MIKENLNTIITTIPSEIKLVAVSKTHPVAYVVEAYSAGQRLFGENKVQELCEKYEILPKDINWHFIGHLQTNKVKFIAPFINLIHGVDSLKLLKVINNEAIKNNRNINCLLQMHIAQEETKFGLNFDEIEMLLSSEEYSTLKNIKIIGLMGMASYTDNTIQITKEFQLIKSYFDKIKLKYFPENLEFRELSIGMSGDYRIAIACGSTMIRVGSSIFGIR